MAVLTGIWSLLTAIALGLVNLVLAPYKAATWFYGIMTAESRAASAQPELEALTAKLAEQIILITDLTLVTKKNLHQSRIANMYKVHENDFVIDPNIFENDEID